ncbi:MAG: MerR family transcriptional regulator, light-induced transcriptional regulator [Blastocatellia bacterium]
MKQSFSTKELAEMWDVSESTVKRWADAGTLRCRKTVGGHRKFEMDDIVEFQSRCGLAKSQTHGVNGGSESPCEFKHLLETADYPALTERFRQAALAGQFNFVVRLFDKLQAHGMSLATISEEIIRPAMREVGELWRTGKICVVDEHLAMVATMEALAALHATVEKKTETERLAMVGCAEGEMHQLAAILVRDLLESEAWKVIYFSSPTPLFSFAEAVDRFKPQLVCISITMADNIERARRDYEDLRRAAERQHTKIVLGGAALSDAAVRARFPESYYAGSLHDLLDLIKK